MELRQVKVFHQYTKSGIKASIQHPRCETTAFILQIPIEKAPVAVQVRHPTLEQRAGIESLELRYYDGKFWTPYHLKEHLIVQSEPGKRFNPLPFSNIPDQLYIGDDSYRGDPANRYVYCEALGAEYDTHLTYTGAREAVFRLFSYIMEIDGQTYKAMYEPYFHLSMNKDFDKNEYYYKIEIDNINRIKKKADENGHKKGIYSIAEYDLAKSFLFESMQGKAFRFDEIDHLRDMTFNILMPEAFQYVRDPLSIKRCNERYISLYQELSLERSEAINHLNW